MSPDMNAEERVGTVVIGLVKGAYYGIPAFTGIGIWMIVWVAPPIVLVHESAAGRHAAHGSIH